jgi:hypothetical protein
LGYNISFAAEFKIEGRATNTVVRSILCLALGTIGSNDHLMVDVPDLNWYKGSFMAKADGVKVYIFCYEFGYMMCVTDPESTVVSFMASTTHKDLPKIFKKPDVVMPCQDCQGTHRLRPCWTRDVIFLSPAFSLCT